MEMTVIIWMLALGIAIAICINYYNSRFLGRLVRKLVEIDATSPESAMTLEELGIALSPALKHALRPGTSFSSTVIKTEDDRYYIAPDRLGLAKAKYRGKDINIVFIIITLVMLAIVAFALTQVLPDIISNTGSQLTGWFDEGQQL